MVLWLEIQFLVARNSIFAGKTYIFQWFSHGFVGRSFHPFNGRLGRQRFQQLPRASGTEPVGAEMGLSLAQHLGVMSSGIWIIYNISLYIWQCVQTLYPW